LLQPAIGDAHPSVRSAIGCDPDLAVEGTYIIVKGPAAGIIVSLDTVRSRAKKFDPGYLSGLRWTSSSPSNRFRALPLPRFWRRLRILYYCFRHAHITGAIEQKIGTTYKVSVSVWHFKRGTGISAT